MSYDLAEYFGLIGQGILVGSLFMSLAWMVGYIVSYVIGLLHKA